jgi:glycine cleavage system H protein
MDTSKLRYTETHEWVGLNGKTARIGITDHAQKEISDVVFVELPKIGKKVNAKDSVMVVESVKAAFDIYAPMSGTVVKANDKLSSKPELVNQSPLGDGWLYELECSNPAEFDTLMTEAQYKESAAKAHR